MTFATIPAGISLFVDANIFVYHFAPDPVLQPPCQQLLERIARHELAGFTSTHVLSDVAHRLMTLEAMAQFGWPAAGIGRRLRQHPAEIQRLTSFPRAIQEIPRFGVQVLPTTYPPIETATSVSQRFGLLTGDALILAAMEANGLIHVASNDPDFDRVPGLVRYAAA